MTAAEYQQITVQAAQDTGRIEAATEQLRTRSWEPAARHYRDLDETERKEYEA